MGTYFHGNSEIQTSADNGLQTLILMNPAYVGFSDTHQDQHHVQTQSNFFLSPASNSHAPLPPPPPMHTQQFVGMPTVAYHEISALHGLIPRPQHGLWSQAINHSAARESPRANQGLSLSLSNSKQQAKASAVSDGDEMRMSGGQVSLATGLSGIQNVLLSSKYLKAAQQLLEESVNVGNGGVSTGEGTKKTSVHKGVGESSIAGDGEIGAAELSMAERQEIQMKKAKLLVMLDEVQQRYRQYQHQMQIVISSFEQAAGVGSAKVYTSLALKTISKQFRCLKDAILSQIRAANKSLGEDDGHGEISAGSRLKLVDNQIRQQRALQQLGMIQHNAWRPQRGLPERSVSVLRAWLFEHFLHPYPKDSDKHMLAKQTGLTRSQVSNWFINARVRLWKPMVEEMYKEEMKEQGQNGADDKTSKNEPNDGEAASKSQDKSHFTENIQTKSFQDNSSNQNAPIISTSILPLASPSGSNARNQTSFSLVGSSELEGITQSSPKKQRSGNEMLHFTSSWPPINKHNEVNNEHGLMKFDIERQGRENYPIMGGEFGSFPIGDIGRYDTNQFQSRFPHNGISLTLGLPDCDKLSMSGSHQSFLHGQNIQLGRRLEMAETDDYGSIITQTPHSDAAYERLNIQNRKRFPAQLLPDFVA